MSNITNNNNTIEDWAEICIKLLKGPIIKKSNNDKLWNLLVRDRAFVDNYFAKIGITLLLDEADGYAFIKQKADITKEDKGKIDCYEEQDDENSIIDEDDNEDTIRLIRRMKLSPEESFLCVVLREALDYFESSDNLSEIFALTESEIMEHVKDYYPNYSDELKFKKSLTQTIHKLEGLGYLEDLTKKDIKSGRNKGNVDDSNHTYEIKKIIRAVVTPDFLEEFKKQLDKRNKKNVDSPETEKGENDE